MQKLLSGFLLVLFCKALFAQCPPLGPIQGPTQLQACAPFSYQYSVPNSADANLVWTLNPPPPNGTGALPVPPIGESIDMVWTGAWTAQLCATPTNPCYAAPLCITINVTAPPPIDHVPIIYMVCPGTHIFQPLTGPPINTMYTWTNNNTDIGLPAAGVGDIDFITANPYPFNNIALIQAWPWQGSCQGHDQTFFVTVLPGGALSNPPNDTAVCTNQPLNIHLTGTAGAVFNWTNSNPVIGLPASGSGDIVFTSSAVTAPQVATITVTPHFGMCNGTPVMFHITVSPGPTMNDPPDQTVCANEMVDVTFTGSAGNPIYQWTNSNPAIGLAPSGSGNLHFTAVNGSAATISGNIVVTPFDGNCIGTPQNFSINVLPPVPPMNVPADVSTCGNKLVNVSFSGSAGATYNWTNSNTNIGLPASGNGNLSFTTPIVANTEIATITVTPKIGNCTGAAITFKITVFPGPTVNDPPDISTCAGASVAVIFTGSGTNPTYNWTNTNPAIGLAASGSGAIHFTATGNSMPQTATITITAIENNCTGIAQTMSILVAPNPSVEQPQNLILCAGESINVHFNGTPDAIFNWTNSNPNIGLAASGSGDLDGIATAMGGTELATITVTPLLNGCLGAAKTFTILIKPLPILDAVTNISACADELISINFNSDPPANFSWTNTNTQIGLQSGGNGAIEFTTPILLNPQTGLINVFPFVNGCAGPKTVFSITVSPPITVVAMDEKLGCDTLPTYLHATTTANPANYLWWGPGGFISMITNPPIDTIGNYIVVVTNPISGCTATDTALVSNCCITKAGNFDTLKINLCNKKPFNGFYKNNQVLEGNDQLKFILFKDTLNVLGSILAYSDSAYFEFNADTMFIDTTYFIAAIAADTTIKHDSINLKDPCLSISKRLSVIWKSNPTIKQLPFSTAICKEDCINLVFEITGTPPFSYQLKIEQNGLLLYDKSMISTDFIQPLTICPIDFSQPISGGELHFLFGALSDFYCGCGK